MTLKTQTWRHSVSAIAIAAMFASPAAFAQETDTEDTVSVAEAQPQEEAVSVQDTIVTVGRRVTTLQDYAGTAALLTGDQIKQLGIQNIEDIDSQIPGLSVANNQGNIEVYIRGVGSSNNTELGDPAAATHLNGVYVPRPSGFGAAFFDIQRVEVNVGPQGTLRGRNATAGSVDIIPWAPGIGSTDAGFEVGVGNYNEVTLEGYANIAVTDNSAFRIAGYYLERDSYLESVTPCSADLGLDIPTCEGEGVGVAEAADDFGVRAAYLIEPTDRFTFTLTGDYLENKGTGYTGINFANPLGNDIDPESIDNPREVFGRGFTPREDVEHWGVKAHLEYDGDWFNAEYIGSMRDLVYDYEFITPASPNYPGALENIGTGTFDDFSRVRFITDSESTVHELRFFSDEGDKVYWTAGAFLFEEDQRTFLGTTGDRNPFFQGVEFNQTTSTESYSFYGDATWSVNDDFRLTGGIRHTNDEKERFGVNARYAFCTISAPDFGCPGVGIGYGTEGFEFNALNRTIFNPDANSNGEIDGAESIAFFLDGVRNFGDRDGWDDLFAFGVDIQDAGLALEDLPQCEGDGFVVSDPANCSFDFDNPVNNRLLATVTPFFSNFALQSGRLENDFTDWRLRAEYDVTPDNLFYGLIATGNKSGGFNDNIEGTDTFGVGNPALGAPATFNTDTLAPTYDPEQLTLYEIGSKNAFTFDDISGTLNVSAFYYDYEDLQLTTLLSTAQALEFEGFDLSQFDEDDLASLGGQVVGFTFNAADAEIYGGQIEGGVDLPGDINLRGTLLMLTRANIVSSQEIQDSRYQADVDAGNAVNRPIDGNRLPRTPEIQFNGSISKAVETDYGTFDGIVSAGYRSSSFMTIFNGIDYDTTDAQTLNGSDARLDDKVDGYWTFDLGAGYSHGFDDKWRIEGYIANVTDVQKPQAIIITQFDNTRFFNRPRTYGARLRMRF